MVIREDILNILHVNKVLFWRIANYLWKKNWAFFQLALSSLQRGSKIRRT